MYSQVEVVGQHATLGARRIECRGPDQSRQDLPAHDGAVKQRPEERHLTQGGGRQGGGSTGGVGVRFGSGGDPRYPPRSSETLVMEKGILQA